MENGGTCKQKKKKKEIGLARVIRLIEEAEGECKCKPERTSSCEKKRNMRKGREDGGIMMKTVRTSQTRNRKKNTHTHEQMKTKIDRNECKKSGRV